MNSNLVIILIVLISGLISACFAAASFLDDAKPEELAAIIKL